MTDACRSSEGAFPTYPPQPLLSTTLLDNPAHSLIFSLGFHSVPDTLAQTSLLSSRSMRSMAFWASVLESFKLNPLFITHTVLSVPSESIKVHLTAQSSESPRLRHLLSLLSHIQPVTKQVVIYLCKIRPTCPQLVISIAPPPHLISLQYLITLQVDHGFLAHLSATLCTSSNSSYTCLTPLPKPFSRCFAPLHNPSVTPGIFLCSPVSYFSLPPNCRLLEGDALISIA